MSIDSNEQRFDYLSTRMQKRGHHMLDYIVLYQSETGNTGKIATEIFSALPGRDKDLVRVDITAPIPDAKNYFIGFGVNRGTCNMEVADLISEIHGKKISLFATCGANPIPEYKKEIEAKVTVWIDEDNEYGGFYLCQGKMPCDMRAKYESMRNGSNDAKINAMIRNFEEAKLHPDLNDLQMAREFATQRV